MHVKVREHFMDYNLELWWEESVNRETLSQINAWVVIVVHNRLEDLKHEIKILQYENEQLKIRYKLMRKIMEITMLIK